MKLDKNPDPKEIQKSPELNDPTSNFNAVSVLNLNSDGTGAEVQVTPKPMDWKGKIFNLFNRPAKKNKVFTETSRNTELQNEYHNEEDNIVPKISEYLIENGGCNVEVQDVKNKKLNEQMLLSTFDPTTHKNTIKANRNDEKHKFLFTPNNEEEDKKNSEKEILEDPTKIPALNEIIPKNI